MRPELQLLLCYARVCLTLDHSARAALLLGAGLDWQYLKRAAARHGMLTLLHWHLDQVDTAAVPRDFLADLRDHFHNNAKRNLFLTGELIKLLRLFESHGVPAVAFKGPLLAAVLYHNIALREFVDLDILVRREDVPKVAALLAGQSYEPAPSLPAAQEGFYLNTHCERSFSRTDGKSHVDLHWGITSDLFPYPVNTDDLLGRLQPTTLGGTVVKTLDVNDLLPILCVHAAKDSFARLEWLCAIGELVSAGEVDWARVMRAAKGLHCERRVLTAMSLVHDLLGIDPPVRVLQRVQSDRAIKRLSRLARARLLDEGHGSRGVLERNNWKLRVLDRRRDGLRAIIKAGILPTLPDWKGSSLPASLFFLYYPRRLARLLMKHVLRRSKR